MCSTVLFSLTESRTSFHAPPCSLKTSFCGSVNRIAVSCQWMFIVLSCSIVVCCVRAVPCMLGERSQRLPSCLRGNACVATAPLPVGRGHIYDHHCLQAKVRSTIQRLGKTSNRLAVVRHSTISNVQRPVL